MSVIKGCLKEESKELKKLVTIYWEVTWCLGYIICRLAVARFCMVDGLGVV